MRGSMRNRSIASVNVKKDGAQRHHLDPSDPAFDADACNHRRRDAFQRQLGVDHRLARSDMRRQR